MTTQYPTTATAEAAAFIEALTPAMIPREAARIGRRCVLDGLSVMIAGLAEETYVLLADDAQEQGGRKDALLFGRGRTRVPAPIAARVLGGAGHAHDWDDTQVSNDPRHQYGLLTHPTVPPLAAALAVSQLRISQGHKVSGADFFTAFMAGFEVECKLSEWLLPFTYKERSFHSSGVVGLFGAAAASAKLLGLTGDKLRIALSICASMAAGCRVNFGTMSKPLQVARAVHLPCPRCSPSCACYPCPPCPHCSSCSCSPFYPPSLHACVRAMSGTRHLTTSSSSPYPPLPQGVGSAALGWWEFFFSPFPR